MTSSQMKIKDWVYANYNGVSLPIARPTTFEIVHCRGGDWRTPLGPTIHRLVKVPPSQL